MLTEEMVLKFFYNVKCALSDWVMVRAAKSYLDGEDIFDEEMKEVRCKHREIELSVFDEEHEKSIKKLCKRVLTPQQLKKISFSYNHTDDPYDE